MRLRTIIASTAVLATMATGIGFAPAAVAAPSAESTTEATSSDNQGIVEKAIESGDLELQAKEDQLDLEGSTSTVNDAGRTLVMIPLTDAGSEYSNVMAVIEDGKVADYTEAHFTETDKNSGHAKVWQNGELTTDDDFSADDSQVQPKGVGDAVSALNDCLASAGIPAWVIAAATAVRSFGSLPGYIACLTAAGVGGGTAGYCAAAAWDAL